MVRRGGDRTEPACGRGTCRAVRGSTAVRVCKQSCCENPHLWGSNTSGVPGWLRVETTARAKLSTMGERRGPDMQVAKEEGTAGA